MASVVLAWFAAAMVSARALKTAGVGGVGGRNGSRVLANGIALVPEVNQSLILCNAYAHEKAISVFRSREKRNLIAEPLKYKSCTEVQVPLQESDSLEFNAGQLPIGTFLMSNLPKHPSTLLLIPTRRDDHSLACTFQSHMFSELQTPQAVLIDAYKGTDSPGAFVEIADMEVPAASSSSSRRPLRREGLKFKNTVALKPGNYQVGLVAQGQEDKEYWKALSTLQQLAVSDKGKYVIARVGVSSNATSAYPQDLIVFAEQRSSVTADQGFFQRFWSLVAPS